jgi:geranyl-CoA carboxylase beta subunit
VREIIARIADGSEFLDFKNEFDSQTVCGHGQIEGQALRHHRQQRPDHPARRSQGRPIHSAVRAEQPPILFFHNTTGFMVGTDAEQNGVIKHGSKMIQAVANATVPKMTIVVGGSYGAGNYAMCGRGWIHALSSPGPTAKPP